MPPVLRATHADLAKVHDRLFELQDVKRQIAAGEAPASAADTVLDNLLVEVLAAAATSM